MMMYSYIVNRDDLSDTEKECLLGGCEVLASLPPRAIRNLTCCDFQFPNGDTFALLPTAIDLTSAIAFN
jgi:hypothetical protein